MARLPETEPLYKTFQEFAQRCLLEDRSLLWPDKRVWTRDNVAEVGRRLIDAPMLGSDLSFEAKLEKQMAGASPEQWAIICDTYYVYFLPSTFIKLETKQKNIAWAAQQAGLVLPPASTPIWEAQKTGFVRTTLKYHYKYAQFWLILLFARHLKGLADPQVVLNDPQRMQQTLDQLLESIPSKSDRAYDMRHALLYMAFPDLYERSISTQDKDRIVSTYRHRIPGPVPDDHDVAIRLIRDALSKEHDRPDRSFDFYSDLKDEWRSPPVSPPPEIKPPPVSPPPPIEDDDVRAVLSTLARTRNVILYGPPGTGKTYIARKTAEALVASQVQTGLSGNQFVQWVTFHQSYSYEDFVEGLRPVPSEEDPRSISYQVIPGVFRRICARAADDPRNKYVLIIDEINRGNIAKILGELITLLEDDKRAGEPNALSVILPYSGKFLTVPGNLYIIGTMNTADRSIALLDVALRRRFAFVELMPRPELLGEGTAESSGAVVPLTELLRSLNQAILRHLDRDHQIGHSYFLKVLHADPDDRLAVLEFVWNSQIIPLLEEYFYSQQDKLAEILAPFRTDVERGAELSFDNTVNFEPIRYVGDDLIFALAKLAGSVG